MTFSELNIDQDMVDALAAKGIIEPFPIQAQTIPLALDGQDIIGQAKTGTGKTFGFGLPVIQRLGLNPAPGVQALIVVPTRELCVQVYEDLAQAAENRPTSVVAIYGGKAYEGQIEQIKSGAQIVVGTPGRLLDLASQRLLNLGNVREMVLDEADKMLDLGFLADIEKLFAQTPATRHTMLFSATMPGPIVALARRFMTRPIHIRATDPDEGQVQANIKHLIYRAHALDKDEVVARILQAEGRGKTVVFTRTKRAAAKLVEELGDRGFNAAAVHGDLNQEQRERAMAAFKAGKKDILIATDVAARGIDVPGITHVFNYDLPKFPEDYVHRIGRTGRAGRKGLAVSLVNHSESINVKRIERFTKQVIPVDIIEGYEPKKTASSARPGSKPGWRPGDGNKRAGAGGGAKPSQRTFSKPGSAPRKEGSGFGKGPRTSEGQRRNWTER